MFKMLSPYGLFNYFDECKLFLFDSLRIQRQQNLCLELASSKAGV